MDVDNEVGGTKKLEHNLHGACTRLREVRKSYGLPLHSAS